MDVYAQNFVPLWLRAVNESTVHYHYSEPIIGLDYRKYVASFAGSDHLLAVNKNPFVAPTQASITTDSLRIQTYHTYWEERLNHEIRSQDMQLKQYLLFCVDLLPSHVGPQIFNLRVPGLRENNPRLDLGDKVYVRPLIDPYPNISQDTIGWYENGKHMQIPAPGSIGTAFVATVWALDRRQESVRLLVDGFPGGYKCNICFTLQEQPHESFFRATTYIADNLYRNSWLRSMLQPETENCILTSTLFQAYFGLKWVDGALNWEQKKAVHTVVEAEYGTVPFLVFGPPGTGKTKTLVEIALQLLFPKSRQNQNELGQRQLPGMPPPSSPSEPVPETDHHLLICAPSDSAADTLASRLAAHLSPSQMLRLNNWTRTFAEVPGNLLPYTYSHADLFSLPPFEKMMSYKVVVTTCRDADMLVQARLTNESLSKLISMVTRHVKMPQVPLHWTALLLDEAGQATEPEVLIPLQVLVPPNNQMYAHQPQFIAAGDEFQLGPKLVSKVTTGLEISLFQRLSERRVYSDHPLSRANGAPHLKKSMLPMMRPAFCNLKINYRSHASFLAVPSVLFYNDTLIPERETSEVVTNWSGWVSPYNMPLLFVNTNATDDVEHILSGNGTGYGALVNREEAQIALSKVQSLLAHSVNKVGPHEIAVISPFWAQVNHLRQVFRHNNLHTVNIGPLEAFQGLESRIVILCTTRTRLGDSADLAKYVKQDQQLGLGIIDQPKRFNVAITRAKEGLIVIGNADCLTCTQDKCWSTFLNFCKRNGCFEGVTLTWKEQQPGNVMGRLEKMIRLKAFPNTSGTALGGGRYDGGDEALDDRKLLLKGSQPDMGDMWNMREVVLSSVSEFVWGDHFDADEAGNIDMDSINQEN